MDPADETLIDEEFPDGSRRRIHMRFSALSEPTVLRSLAGLLVALTVLAWPERTDLVLARLIGLGLILTELPGLWSLLRSRSGKAVRWLTTVGGPAIGLLLFLFPEQSTVFVVRVVAAWLAVRAVGSLIEGWRAPGAEGPSARGWIVARTLLILTGAGLLAVYPAGLLAIATTAAAAGFAFLAVVAIAKSVSADDARVYDVGDSLRMVSEWLLERPKSLDDREALYAKLLYEGPTERAKIARFVTLMVLASVISATGVLADSTAVVIGAMLVAPLMTPLMAAAMCLIMGWPERLWTSTLIAIGGIALAIAIGLILGLATPTLIDFDANGQIASRTLPTTLNLITAVAAGAAGPTGCRDRTSPTRCRGLPSPSRWSLHCRWSGSATRRESGRPATAPCCCSSSTPSRFSSLAASRSFSRG